MSKTDFGGSIRERIPSGLGSQGRRAGETSIDLNDAVIETIWLKCILHVALTNNSKMTTVAMLSATIQIKGA
jgi:hypothetical protein